jgi:HrpA-like RNA helicase
MGGAAKRAAKRFDRLVLMSATIQSSVFIDYFRPVMAQAFAAPG